MINVNNITLKGRLYNLHTHTQFCDGHAPMESFVTHAISLGFSDLGFSPHAPLSFPSSCNMSKNDVPRYFSELNRLKMCYGDKISIYGGMEIDFVDEWGPSNPYFASLSLDYRIGSVHFIRSFVDPGKYIDIDGSLERFTNNMHQHFHNDIEKVIHTFYSQSIKMIEAGGFDIIGHLDKISQNASLFATGIDNTPWYDKLVKRTIECVMDHNLIVEINTKSWEQHHRFFPNQKYFTLLKQYNAPVIFNSDAHYPERLNSGRMEAIQAYTAL